MEPRLKSSKKWTSLPGELLKQIRLAFEGNFAEKTKCGRFEIAGRIYREELLMRVGYLENGSIRQSNFEISAAYKADKDQVIGLVHSCVDVAATLMQELFQDAGASATFPAIWTSFELEDKREVFVQFSGVNSELEAEADRLLKASGEVELVKFEDDDQADDEELASAKLLLGVNDEPEDPTSGH